MTPDSARHQHSLNQCQADLAPDGSFTVVVAHQDPGVANWIDPGGLREGILMLRWQRLGARPASAAPGLHAWTAPVAELDARLPAGVRRASAGERQRQRAERAAGYAQRFLGG